MKNKRKEMTEKQLKEKIKEIKSQISYLKRTIERTIQNIKDQEILLNFYLEELAKKYDNPSSSHYGGPNKIKRS